MSGITRKRKWWGFTGPCRGGIEPQPRPSRGIAPRHSRGILRPHGTKPDSHRRPRHVGRSTVAGFCGGFESPKTQVGVGCNAIARSRGENRASAHTWEGQTNGRANGRADGRTGKRECGTTGRPEAPGGAARTATMSLWRAALRNTYAAHPRFLKGG